MKVIVAGGRDYVFTSADVLMLAEKSKEHKITEIVHGGCRGADLESEKVANVLSIPVKVFPANWKKHGTFAGPMRNRQMAEYADAVILFPGGRGTSSMRRLSKEYGLKILYDAQEN